MNEYLYKFLQRNYWTSQNFEMMRNEKLLYTIWHKEQENPWDIQEHLAGYLIVSIVIHEYKCVKRIELN